ncbi:MAG TPA: monomethylamine:corrinoid methyltransferase [Desulfurococcales archaeon]|nr:monomethylamine:corrinoid methyltransferase [Desulfurococcales archaeon]
MYLDIVDKSEQGPYIEERDFDKLLICKVKELIREYEITYDPEEVIPSDNTLANDVWRAGYRLLLEVGGYNISTRRRIVFDDSEVKSALKNIPDSIVIGQGCDARVMKHRRVEDTEQPIIEAGPTGTLVSEDIYLETMISFAQEDYIDAVGSGSLKTFNGREVKVGSPLELRAAAKIISLTREALRIVNKPGLHINDVAVTTPWAKMVAISEDWGIRRTDGILVAQMVELKTSYEHIALAEFAHKHGVIVGNLMTPIWGSYGGGSPGTAIISVAEHIFGLLAYKSLKHYLSLTHIFNCNNTGRETLWVISVVGQAIANNSKMITLHDCYTATGPGTKTILYEVAAGAITSAVSGLHGTGVGSAGGKFIDQETGLECRLYGEVAKHSVKLRRSDANEIVKKLISKYEDLLRRERRAIPGKSFRELYDIKTVKPVREWLKLYNEVKRELIDLGIPLPE